MDVSECDEKMNNLASEAAGQFVRQYDLGNKQVTGSPETVLQHAIPYLTVRTLHDVRDTLDRHENALQSLKADSKWIK